MGSRIGAVAGAVVVLFWVVFGWTAPAGAAEKEAATLSVDLGGGVSMTFALIPAGSFVMGDEAGNANEKPAHKVTLSKPFYLGQHEVTQEQWQAVMGSNPSQFTGPKLPVERVTWADCQAFLKKLAAKVPGKTFRLPTEAEWEYACRAQGTGRYSFGDEPKGLGDHAWFLLNSAKATHPVGEKKPNAWGLYDMHGNVQEWCQDSYALYQAGEQTDPSGAAAPGNRVTRGGAWDYDAGRVRSAARNSYAPAMKYSDLGVRVVLVPGP
jgi:formylglycine-generating enzyme required for sulfatase activity